MTEGKIKPVASIVAQFAANVEVEAIQHNGKIFLPVMSLGSFTTNDEPLKKSTVAKEESVSTSEEKTSKKTAKEEPTKKVATYTEEELMEKDVKELTKILKGLGIDPDDTEGKNTNKKLRLLILNAPTSAGSSEEDDDDDDDEQESPKESSKVSDVVELLEAYEAGELARKKFIAKVTAMGEDGFDADKLGDILDGFDDDASADVKAVAENIVNLLEGKTKKAAKPSKGEAKKETAKSTKKAGKVVAKEDLEEGDKVSVYWEEEEEWFTGVVESVDGDEVTVLYTDETSYELDDNNTKIKFLG
jgi:hypothetical protein